MTCSKGALDELNRAQEIQTVQKTDWHLVFLQSSNIYLVMKEKGSLQWVSCKYVLSHPLGN